MIEHINISDFAIIKHTDVDFYPGLNVITGETGAGKSIVIEAMSLALGARADSSLVRHGATKAKIQMQADLDEKPCIITRELGNNGRNICRIDGDLVNLSQIQEKAHKIADIHGQYDNQALLDPERHIELVDNFRREIIKPKKDAFTKAYNTYKEVRFKFNKLKNEKETSQALAEKYQYEIDEINNSDLQPGEDDDLKERISVMRNSEKIFEAAILAQEMLSLGEDNAGSLIGRANSQLSSVSSYSTDISELSKSLDSMESELQEIDGRLSDLLESLDYEPGEVDRLIDRLDLIESLKRKYANSIPDILKHRDELTVKLEKLHKDQKHFKELEVQTKPALNALKSKAAELTKARKQSAMELEKAILNELHELNFPHANLKISIEPARAINATGADDCEILISTNKGEPLKSLSKTASGGEISRIMLAIKNVTGSDDQIPTMIFDEIDTGISGITASVVARKLQQIAKDHQIICITHLPQIAAAADVNYRIYKDSDEDATFSHIQELSDDQRTEEIARLLGGDTITDVTLESARELIASMQTKKNK